MEPIGTKTKGRNTNSGLFYESFYVDYELDRICLNDNALTFIKFTDINRIERIADIKENYGKQALLIVGPTMAVFGIIYYFHEVSNYYIDENLFEMLFRGVFNYLFYGCIAYFIGARFHKYIPQFRLYLSKRTETLNGVELKEDHMDVTLEDNDYKMLEKIINQENGLTSKESIIENKIDSKFDNSKLEDKYEVLIRFKELLDKEILTQAEFDSEKKKILEKG